MLKRFVNLIFVTVISLGNEISVKVGDTKTIVLNKTFNNKYNLKPTLFFSKSDYIKISNYSDPKIPHYPCNLLSYRFTWYTNLRARNTNLNIICIGLKYNQIQIFSKSSYSDKKFSISRYNLMNFSPEADWYMMISNFTNMITTISKFEQVKGSKSEFRVKANFIHLKQYFSYRRKRSYFRFIGARKEELRFSGIILTGRGKLRHGLGVKNCFFWFRKKFDNLNFLKEDNYIFYYDASILKSGKRRNYGILNLEIFNFQNFFSKDIIRNGKSTFLVVYGKKQGMETSKVFFYLIREENNFLEFEKKDDFLFDKNPGFLYSNSDNSTIMITQFDKQKNFLRAEIFKVKFKEKISFKKIFEKIYFIPLNHDNYELYPEESFNLDNTIGFKFYSKNSNRYKFTITLTYNLTYNKIKKKEEVKNFLLNYNAFEEEDGEGVVFPFSMKKGTETNFISFEITKSELFKPSIIGWNPKKYNLLKLQIKVERKKNLDISSKKLKKIEITAFNITEKKPEIKKTQLPIILYKDSFQKIKIDVKIPKEIAYKTEISQIWSINSNTFSGSLIKVKSDNKENKVEIFHQKSNDVKIEFRKKSEIPILDHIYHIKNGIFGVTNRLKVFLLKCEIIRKQKSFQFIFLCDFERYLNIDFIKSDIVDFTETENHFGFITQKIDSDDSFLYVVEKFTKKTYKNRVNRTIHTKHFLADIKEIGFRYALFKPGSNGRDIIWMTTIFKNGKFKKFEKINMKSYSAFTQTLENQKCIISFSPISGVIYSYSYFSIMNYCQKNQEKISVMNGRVFNFFSFATDISEITTKPPIFRVDVGNLPRVERRGLKACSFPNEVILIKTETMLFAKINSASADYYDFDLHHFNFEKNLKLICFVNLGYATLISKIKNQRRMGILTVDLRQKSKNNFFDVNGRIYDYFERDFLQTHPDFIKGFDVSPNSNFPQIVIQFIMFRKFYSTLISLKGPLVFVKYPKNSLSGKKDFVAYNGEKMEKFQIYFNMINSQVSKIKANVVKRDVKKTLESKKFKLKNLVKIDGHTTKIFLQYQSGVKKLLSITKERIRFFEKNIPKLDFKDKNCGLIKIKFPIIVALCGIGNLKYLKIIHKKYGLVRHQPLDKIRLNQALTDTYAKFELNNYLDFAFEKVNHTEIKIQETHLIVITLMKKIPKNVSDENENDYAGSSPVVLWMCFEDKGHDFVYNKTFIHDHEYKKFSLFKFEEKSFSFMTNTSDSKSVFTLIFSTVYAIQNNRNNKDSGISIKIFSTGIKTELLMLPFRIDNTGNKITEIHFCHKSSYGKNLAYSTFIGENGSCARYLHLKVPEYHVLLLFTEVNRYKLVKTRRGNQAVIEGMDKSTIPLDEHHYGSFEVADCRKISEYKFRCAKVLNSNQIVVMDYEVETEIKKYYFSRKSYIEPKGIKILGRIEIYNKHTREIYEKIRLGQKHIACLLLHMQTSKSILMIYRRKKKLEKIGEKIEKTEFDNVFYSLPLLRFTNPKNFKNVEFYFENNNGKEEFLVVYNAIKGKFEKFEIGEMELEQRRGKIENYIGANFKIENLQSQVKKKLTDIFVEKELKKKLENQNKKKVESNDGFFFRYFSMIITLFLLILVVLLYFIRRERLKIQKMKEAERNMIYDLKDFNF